jgi:hypothetical protein
MILKIIKGKGFSDVGLLSVLYTNKYTEEFYCGLFKRENEWYIVFKTDIDKFIYVKIENEKIEQIIRREINLYSILNYRRCIGDQDFNKISSFRFLMFKLKIKIAEISHEIYLLPNVYYIWHQYKINPFL